MSRIIEIRNSRMRVRRATAAATAVVALVLMLLTTSPASAQSFNVLYSFKGSPDGAYPFAGLVMDNAGNFYGTTQGGACLAGGIAFCGTVFTLDPAGNETILTRLGGVSGAPTNPYANLVRDTAGDLYGTTRDGGAFGLGTVFKIDASGNGTVLHSFLFSDGAEPYGGLVMDTAGNLYGTTSAGGPGTPGTVFGTIFKLDTSGNYTVLHTFTLSDGAGPTAAPIMDAAGNLYGTTSGGGSSIDTGVCSIDITNFGCGTVYKLDPSGNLIVLHNFTGGDGWSPSAPLIMDNAGNLYGTTTAGGSTFNGAACTLSGGLGQNGCGTVFKLDPFGNLTVLHSFTGGSDGAAPYYGGLVMDAANNVYGTTLAGGTGACTGRNAIIIGCGIVFKVNSSSNERVLYSFTGASDGAFPYGGLVIDGTGNLYGTTSEFLALGGYGTVFKLAVQTPQQATQSLITSVNSLFSQGVLNGGQDNSLVKTLQQAINLMNAGKNAGAIQNLDVFINEVSDLLNSGVLSVSQAGPLISTAKSVIARLP